MFQNTLFILLFAFSSLYCKKIAVVGWMHGVNYIKDFLEENLAPLGHQIEVIWKDADFDSYDLIVSCNAHYFLKEYKFKTIVSTFEPPIIIKEHGNYNDYKDYLCIFTWHHDMYNGHEIKKFYYPCEHKQDLDRTSMLPFKKRRLACMVNSHLTNWHPEELYSVRKKICLFYQQYYPSSFSLYGKRGWGPAFYPVFKGMADDKDLVLRSHKFNYCYENWLNDSYYISEKLFESFNSLCVPIYLGSSKVTKYIPAETFIDARKFKNLDELHTFLATMDEATYMSYINAIIEFNQSETVKLFSSEYHNQNVLNEILLYL